MKCQLEIIEDFSPLNRILKCFAFYSISILITFLKDLIIVIVASVLFLDIKEIDNYLNT